MAHYQYCTHDGCTWTAQWGGGSATDDPSTKHRLDNPTHVVRGGESALHSRLYYRQQNGGNVTDSAPTTENWPLSHVAPGEVPRDPSEAQLVALYAELNALREKIDEWSCDTEGCEKMSIGTRGVNGPQECRACAGFTTDGTSGEQGESA